MLEKLFWLCHCSEYTQSSYIFDRLLKMPQVLNVLRFWTWHGCICKGYPVFWICMNMAYVLIWPKMSPWCLNIPQSAFMSLTISGFGWILLNVPKYAWRYLNKLFRQYQNSKYALSPYLFGRVLNTLEILNMQEFWIYSVLVIIKLLLSLWLMPEGGTIRGFPNFSWPTSFFLGILNSKVVNNFKFNVELIYDNIQ